MIAFLCIAICSTVSMAQSSSFLGQVLDKSGQPLPGANVTALHQPSGTFYGTSTRDDGRFNLPDVRIGGPYHIEVSFTGFETFMLDNVDLSLGQNYRVDVKLQESSTTLGEVVVTAVESEILNSERTGAATNIKKEAINSLPTLSRSLNDFVRLTPQSRSSNVAATTGSGISFAGQDSRFNNLTLDGSIFNNSFGLASAPAGQTNSSPISLDAVDEIQINLAPYDVRQGGFTGAGINAVTRSGTNQFEGSVFYNTRSESLAGSKADGTDINKTDFSIKQTGFRLGGPLIKNKLFFFVNGEIERRDDPATPFVANRPGLTGDNVTIVEASDLDELKQFLINKYDYDPGVYENYLLNTKSDKLLAKVDYNINKNNRLSFRFNYLKSSRDVLTSNSGSFSNRRDNGFAMNFSNSNYIINNDIYSGIMELNSMFGTKFSNKVQFGFTANRDYRSSGGGIFPLVDILKDGRNYTNFGYEPFTPNNILNTDTWQFQDNVTMYSGAHTITAGVNFEYFKFDNTFTPTYYGQYVYNSLQDFYDDANGVDSVQLRRYALTYSALPNSALPTATTKVAQPGAYIQDEIDLMDNKLKLTVGVRVDVPIYGETALNNPVVDTMSFINQDGKSVHYHTDQLPKTNPLFSPRLGFNYDVKGDRSLQVRGGTGLFSGRPAFVWISNQVGNNGILTGSLRDDNTYAHPFSTDVTAYIPENATTPSSFNIAVTDQDFKFPQLWRTNLAVDFALPYGFVGSLEGIYNKNINNVTYINANQEPSKESFSGADDRPIYAGNTGSRINSKITDAIVLINTKKGSTYSFTAKLERQFKKGFYTMLAYNFSESKDLMTAGSIAFSSWRDNRSVNGNNRPDLAFSDFDQRHRIIGALSYRLEYLDHAATTFSIFMQSSNQGRYSFAVNGDLNNDGLTSNDLIYVPNNGNELLFDDITDSNGNVTASADEQRQAFMAFVENNDYLKSRKGKYAERNGALMPWLTTFDLSVQQEFFVKVSERRHTIQVRADFYNFGNLLSNKWGVGDFVKNNSPLTLSRIDDTTNQPVYKFPKSSGAYPTEALAKDISLNSVWQAQLGIRYIF
ncbi:MAG: TonB-dependent receptor plug domain-containing protein [Bacteroidetes bacterium]|nr:TonB-dependent receptor plug domain-containing protein [Bacteroidota bacterium]